MKKYAILFFFCLFTTVAMAQPKSAKEAYTAFKIYRTTDGDKKEQLNKTLALLKLANQLTANQITNVKYHIGRLYEETQQPDSAIVYYGQSLVGEPNYEVIHRALGFIYLAKSATAVEQMNAATKAKDVEGNKKAYAEYKTLVQKALPHLEKYQACSPDEETLMIITNLYKSLKDTQSLSTLADRLKQMGTTCVSLLEDE